MTDRVDSSPGGGSVSDTTSLERALALAKRLDLHFRSTELLLQALSHRSHGAPHYERLEFLGDAQLGLVIARQLHDQLPLADQGALTRIRAALVRESTLAEIAREFEFGAALRLGGGELKSGAFDRDSILSDAVESIIGATLLDAGHEASAALVKRLYGERLARLDQIDSRAAADVLKDAKTRLQERLQASGQQRPSYTLVRHEGPAHAPLFIVQCLVLEPALKTEASAGSRKLAEQKAAALMLKSLDEEGE